MCEPQVGELVRATPGAWYQVIDRRLPRPDGILVDRVTAQPAPPSVALGDSGELHGSHQNERAARLLQIDHRRQPGKVLIVVEDREL